tara:strand:+ start:343 stop:732 length:390 start_codon:yes stop_codon:yes gene_type:complete
MKNNFKILDPNICHEGSGRTGTCLASYNQLKSIFGPNRYDESGDGKVQVSWVIEVDGKRLEIYAYKFNPEEYDKEEKYSYSISEIDKGSLRSLQGILPELWLFTTEETNRIMLNHGWGTVGLEKYINNI